MSPNCDWSVKSREGVQRFYSCWSLEVWAAAEGVIRVVKENGRPSMKHRVNFFVASSITLMVLTLGYDLGDDVEKENILEHILELLYYLHALYPEEGPEYNADSVDWLEESLLFVLDHRQDDEISHCKDY